MYFFARCLVMWLAEKCLPQLAAGVSWINFKFFLVDIVNMIVYRRLNLNPTSSQQNKLNRTRCDWTPNFTSLNSAKDIKPSSVSLVHWRSLHYFRHVPYANCTTYFLFFGIEKRTFIHKSHLMESDGEPTQEHACPEVTCSVLTLGQTLLDPAVAVRNHTFN